MHENARGFAVYVVMYLLSIIYIYSYIYQEGDDIYNLYRRILSVFRISTNARMLASFDSPTRIGVCKQLIVILDRFLGQWPIIDRQDSLKKNAKKLLRY